MNASLNGATDVLIIGAGPTGLVLALWLARLGVRLRILDKTSEPGTTSRAVAVQARTLEMYRQLGLANTIVKRGRRVEAANLWSSGKQVAHIVFGEMGEGISPFPYALIFPQDEHERLLIDHLTEAGIEVERRTEFEGLTDTDGRVLAKLKREDGTTGTCEAAYIAGCDGARSTVRDALKIGFPGATYEHLFYVADVEAGGPAINGEIHVALDTSDFLAAFPLKEEGRARLIGTVRPNDNPGQKQLSWDDVSRRVIEWMRIDVRRTHWFSTYHVHHRVADHFGRARVFLLGDAAHVHSPVGGQGMNTGIGDAANLAWKLAAVLQGRADIKVLDSYEPERIAFARRLVRTTDQAFTGVISSGTIARQLRLNVIPFLLPPLFSFPAVRRFMFRTVSQTSVNYRNSSLSEGRAGAIHGGDRLPWAGDNFNPLTSLDWQVHVYGDAAADIQSVCAARHLPLHVFPWHPQMGRSQLRRNAVYLVRPDGYVALAIPGSGASILTSYLDARKFIPKK